MSLKTFFCLKMLQRNQWSFTGCLDSSQKLLQLIYQKQPYDLPATAPKSVFELLQTNLSMIKYKKHRGRKLTVHRAKTKA